MPKVYDTILESATAEGYSEQEVRQALTQGVGKLFQTTKQKGISDDLVKTKLENFGFPPELYSSPEKAGQSLNEKLGRTADLAVKAVSSGAEHLGDLFEPVEKAAASTAGALMEPAKFTPKVSPSKDPVGFMNSQLMDLGVTIGTKLSAKQMEGLYGPTAARYVQDVAAGAINTVGSFGGAAKWIGAEDMGQAISRRSAQIAHELEPRDPNFVDQVAQGAGAMAVFYVPGVGVELGAAKLALFGPRMATWLGVAATSTIEASSMAGSAYNASLEKDPHDKDLANQRASAVFWGNLPVDLIANKLGIFGQNGGQIRRAFTSALASGSQMASIEMMSNLALFDPILKGTLQSFGVGAIIGGVASGVHSLVHGVTTPAPPLEASSEPINVTPSKDRQILLGIEQPGPEMTSPIPENITLPPEPPQGPVEELTQKAVDLQTKIDSDPAAKDAPATKRSLKQLYKKIEKLSTPEEAKAIQNEVEMVQEPKKESEVIIQEGKEKGQVNVGGVEYQVSDLLKEPELGKLLKKGDRVQVGGTDYEVQAWDISKTVYNGGLARDVEVPEHYTVAATPVGSDIATHFEVTVKDGKVVPFHVGESIEVLGKQEGQVVDHNITIPKDVEVIQGESDIGRQDDELIVKGYQLVRTVNPDTLRSAIQEAKAIEPGAAVAIIKKTVHHPKKPAENVYGVYVKTDKPINGEDAGKFLKNDRVAAQKRLEEIARGPGATSIEPAEQTKTALKSKDKATVPEVKKEEPSPIEEKKESEISKDLEAKPSAAVALGEWEKGKFTIKDAQGQDVEVKGISAGVYGIWAKKGEYHLTHLPTGRRINSDPNQVKMKALAEALSSAVPELSKVTDAKASKDIIVKAAQVMQDFMAGKITTPTKQDLTNQEERAKLAVEGEAKHGQQFEVQDGVGEILAGQETGQGETLPPAEVPSEGRGGAEPSQRPGSGSPDVSALVRRDARLDVSKPIELSATQRKSLNSKALAVLDKPYDQITEADRELIRQYTGLGGLQAAEEGVLNQHYTSYRVIDFMWAKLKAMGVKFEGAKALEAAEGVGNFLGFKPEGIQFDAIELDERASRIAKILYPEQNHHNMPFEKWAPRYGYDISIGNDPFGDFRGTERYADEAVQYQDIEQIHDFFITKRIDLLNPNGVLAVITSTGTMDKKDSRTRERINKKAEFLGSYRLPQGTFKKNAGFEGSVDILFFRKRVAEELAKPEMQEEFLQTTHVDLEGTGDYKKSVTLSKYYEAHPERILGSLFAGGRYSNRAEVKAQGDLQKVLEKALADDMKLVPKQTASMKEQGGYFEGTTPVGKDESGAPVGSYQVKKDKLLVVGSGGALYDSGKSLRMAPRVTKAIEVMRLSKEFNDSLSSGQVDAKLQKNLKRTVEAYKREFKSAPGYDRMLGQIKDDPRYFLMAGMMDSEGKVSDALVKADFLQQQPEVKPAKKGDLQDAIRYSLESGKGYDVSTIAAALGNDVGHTKALLAKLPDWNTVLVSEGNIEVYHDHDYLFGDLWPKIDQAERDDLPKQVEKLRKALPEQRTLKNVPAGLLYTWLPDVVKNDFLADIGVGGQLVREVNPESGRLEFVVKDGRPGSHPDMKAGRLSPKDIIEKYLNHRKVMVEGENGPVIDPETTKALSVTDKVFESFLRKYDRAELVTDAYNRTYRSFRRRGADSTAEQLPGISKTFKGQPLKVKSHQWEYVNQALEQGKSINAHGVGGGKTLAAIMLGKALEKKGLKRKLLAVPNKVIRKWAYEIKEAFPAANIISLENISADNAYKLLQQVAMNDVDFVLITHDRLKQIPLRDADKYLQEDIDLYEDRLRKLKSKKGARRGSERDIQEYLAKKKERLLALQQMRRTKTIFWEDLRLDALMVDEAHNYKRVDVDWGNYSNDSTISGGNQSSDRANDLYYKTRSMRDSGKGNIHFLTATPTTNRPIEIYSMIRYLAPEEWTSRGIVNAGDFIDHFTEIEAKLVPDLDGVLVEKRLITKYKNLIDLRSIVEKYVDFRPVAELSEVSRPDAEYNVVEVPISEDQKKILGKIVADLDYVARDPKGAAAEGINKMSLTTEGRKAAVGADIHSPEDHPNWAETNSKIAFSVDKVSAIHKKTGAGQLIFLDLFRGYKKAVYQEVDGKKYMVSKPEVMVNYHEKIREQLIARGVKPVEIAIINGEVNNTPAAKARVQEEYNQGKIKIVIGSTTSMGEGMDLQADTVAIHNIDVPWTPAALEQRNGRGVRQGNKNDLVQIFNYMTKGSLDAFMYGKLAVKEKWNQNLWKGKEDTISNDLNNDEHEGLSYEDLSKSLTIDVKTRDYWKAIRESSIEQQAQEKRSKQISDLDHRIVIRNEEIGHSEKMLDTYKQRKLEEPGNPLHQERIDSHNENVKRLNGEIQELAKEQDQLKAEQEAGKARLVIPDQAEEAIFGISPEEKALASQLPVSVMPPRALSGPLKVSITQHPIFVKALAEAGPALEAGAESHGGDAADPHFGLQLYQMWGWEVHDLINFIMGKTKKLSPKQNEKLSAKVEDLSTKILALDRLARITYQGQEALDFYAAKDAGKKTDIKLKDPLMEPRPEPPEPRSLGSAAAQDFSQEPGEETLHPSQPEDPNGLGRALSEPQSLGAAAPGKKQKPGKGFKFSDPETEKRYQEARKGVPIEGMMEKLRAFSDRLWTSMTSEFQGGLPRTPEFARIRYELNKLKRQKGVAVDRSVRILESIRRPMDDVDFDIFQRKILLDDLAMEVKAEHDLPFGFTPESLQAEIDKLKPLMESRERAFSATVRRQSIWDGIKADYIKAMSDIGFNVEDRLKNEAYFRHQVLIYAAGRDIPGKGSTAGLRVAAGGVKTPSGRGFLKKRAGSKLDINASYAEADFEVMTQMIKDIEIAKTIKVVKDVYDISPKLKVEAKATNKQNLEQMMAQEPKIAVIGGRPVGEIEVQMVRYGQNIAYGFKLVHDAIMAGELPPGIAGKWSKTTGSFEQQATEADIDGPDNPQVIKIDDPDVFKLLAELADGEGQSAIGAKLVFKSIAARRTFMQNTLGDNYKTWQDLIPEGHSEWQPREGNLFYFVDTIPAKIAQQIHNEVVASFGITKEMLARSLAMGGPRTSYAIPNELVQTLDLFNSPMPEGPFGDAIKKVLRTWKQWQLISPRRFLRYNLRNISGDADAAFAGNPGVFKWAPQAARELIPAFFSFKTVEGELAEFYKRGGFESNLQAAEMGDLRDVEFLADLFDQTQGSLIGKPLELFEAYWKTAKTATNYREAILRYAAYRDFLAKLDAGQLKEYGASVKEDVDALPNNRDKAFKLSNDLLGAYDEVSVMGQYLREHLLPFWSWKEVNFRRYIQMFKSATSNDASGMATARLAGTSAAKAGLKASNFLIKATAMWIMLQLWNNMMFPDEEKELEGNVQNRPHLVLGRNDKGQVYYFSGVGALGDILAWFGLDAAPGMVSDWFRGKKSLGEIGKDMVKAPFNVASQLISPYIKVPVELAAKQSFYPDVFNPRPVRDRAQYLFRSVALGNEYNALFGVPSRGYIDSLKDLLLYRIDPGQGAYLDIQNAKRSFMEKQGIAHDGGSYSPKGEALYYYKLALRYEDKELADRYLKEYISKGGKVTTLRQSLVNMGPLGGLTMKQKASFLGTLDARDRDRLRRAEVYWQEILLGKKHDR